MIIIVGKEWSLLDGLLNSIIVGKLCKCQEIHPIVLMIVDSASQVLFQNLIDLFSLPICLEMICRI